MAAPNYGTMIVRDGVRYLGSDGTAVYRVDVSNQIAAPTSGAIIAVRDLATGKDVAADVMPTGSVTIESTVYVKLKPLTALEPGHSYLVIFTFTDGTNTLTGLIEVRCPI